MERAKGIEPSCAVWKAAVLPLNYARLRFLSGPDGTAVHRANHTVRSCLVNPPSVMLAAMNSLLLTGGRVIDPANRFDALADVLIQDGKISAVGPNLSARPRH